MAVQKRTISMSVIGRMMQLRAIKVLRVRVTQ